MSPLLTTFAKEIFLQSWWAILFACFCLTLYEQEIKISNETRAALSKHLAALQEEKRKALKEQARLAMEVESQNDPHWIELTLMKELGLTPEGQTKVMFY